MRLRLMTLAAISAASLAAVASQASAQGYASRQYYSGWQTQPKLGYNYRLYYHKPTPSYSGYRHHYVIQTPKDPQHYYYYNPYKKSYWGRCPVSTQGKPLYSLLAEKDRREQLDDIPASAFPPPGPTPPIPDSSDGAVLDLPPDDLPAASVPR